MCSVAEQCSDRPGWHLYSGGNFTRKCVSTTSIEAPIYILLRAFAYGAIGRRFGKSSPCGGSAFPLSLFEWSFTICPTQYNRKYLYVCICLSVSI